MNFNAVCRLFIKQCSILQPIFNTTAGSFHLKVLECTSIEVIQDDGLPENICNDCITKISYVIEFRTLCQQSDMVLRQELSSKIREDVEIKTENSYFDLIYNELSSQNEDLSVKCDNALQNFPEMVIIEGGNLTTIKTISQCRSKLNRKVKVNNDTLAHTDPKNETFLEDIVLSKQKPRIKKITRKVKVSKNKLLDDTDSEKEINTKSDTNTLDSSVADSKNIKPKRIRTPKQCQICGKICIWLRTHMLTHTGIKAFKCEYCGKSFTQLSHYKIHLNIHTGNKPYVCQLCGKGFADPASKRSHIVTHTKERKYKCDVCQKSFGYSHTLSAHKRTHTQDRKHICSVCDKRFLSKYGLTKHFRIHTGEKPYKCEFCDKRFSTSGNIQTHRRIHTRERPYKCAICETTFAYRSVLNSHMKIHVDQPQISNIT